MFFKNIDLCSTDEWGTCEIIELIIQLIRRCGFFTESLEWISVSGLIVCGSMSNTQRQQFSPRYLSIVQNVCIEFPNDAELHLIMKNQFSPMSQRFKQVGQQINQIVESLIQLYYNVCIFPMSISSDLNLILLLFVF